MALPTLLAIFLLILLCFVLRAKSEPKPNDKLARFWKRPKYPTKFDIQKKYQKSQALQQQGIERKRREAREKEKAEAERKKQIFERHLKAARQEMKSMSEQSSK